MSMSRISMLSEANSQAEMENAIAQLPACKSNFVGRGIVIPGGGAYFPSAWVAIRMLRFLGADLPIQLWHLGPEELSEQMRDLIAPYDVEAIDAKEVSLRHPARKLNGWELKCYAIIHSKFREVILLDADNVPVVDPTFLLDTKQYNETGAIFWPDYGQLHPDRSIWRLTGVPFVDEPEFESGQIVVNKDKCWAPLQLAMWMNEFSDFWYEHIHGDKETFHMAWRKLEAPFSMPDHPIMSLSGVMCQHDFEGRRIFQHRNGHKWRVDTNNPRIDGFLFERECLAFIDDLREQWTTRPYRPYNSFIASEQEKQIAEELCSCRWLYRRLGHDERLMSFTQDGIVAAGHARCEQSWTVLQSEIGGQQLIIYGTSLTCILWRRSSTVWSGKWLVHERMPVQLLKLELPPDAEEFL